MKSEITKETEDVYPKIVYKYRNWKEDFHKDVLRKNQLFRTSPKAFNDPFDCRIPTNYHRLNTSEKISTYVDKTLTENYDFLISDGRNIEYEKQQAEYRFTHEMDKMQEKFENILFTAQDRDYGILSLSSLWDSILMWSHYSDHHRGYCIGFHGEKLCKSGADIFGKGGPVRYPKDKDFPVIDPLDDDVMGKAFSETHTKALEWEYEQEYRLTKLFRNAPSDAERTVVVSDDYFAEIVIGLNTPEQDRQEIISIARSKRIKVFQIRKVPFNFLLERDEIQTS